MKTQIKKNIRVNYHLLDRQDNERKLPIVIRSRQNTTKEIVKFTGSKATIKEWDSKNGRFKNNIEENEKLNSLRDSLNSIYGDLLAEGYTPTLDDIWYKLKDSRHTLTPTGDDVIKWIDNYLEKSRDGHGKKKSVITLKTNLTDWNPKIKLSGLTTGTLTRFTDWLNDNGVANNSAYKRIRALTIVSKFASQHVPVCADVFRYEFPYKTKNGTPPRLTYEEVKQVMKTEPMNEIEEVAKDVFLLACFTGLRISDILTINEGELHSFHYEKMQIKTKEMVYITLHKHNEELVRKYFATGIDYSRQKLSDAIYTVFNRAGIDSTYTKYKHVGNKMLSEKRNKVDDMAFHVGRRFYARLLNDLGCGMEIARDELGHMAGNVTEHYSGSPDHRFRISRVREAMKKMEKTMKQISLMKVA
jgi:integrase/recombinase XerD